jgi:hypothetical protein
MKLPRLILALVLLLPAPVAAQAPAARPTAPAAQAPAARPTAPAAVAAQPSFAAQMLAGSWALRVEGTVVFRFDLAPSSGGWSGLWAKPKSFATDGAIFAELSGPPVEQRSQAGRAIGEWAELSFGDARPGAIPDVFRFRLTGPDRAEMLYADTGQAPFVLERVAPGTPPGPWTAGRVYRRAGVQAGSMVSYNVGPRTIPSVEPTNAPPATDRPPAVVGR